MMNKFTYIWLLSLCLLQGCNTMEGVGADIKGTGAALERSAGEIKEEMSGCHS